MLSPQAAGTSGPEGCPGEGPCRAGFWAPSVPEEPGRDLVLSDRNSAGCGGLLTLSLSWKLPGDLTPGERSGGAQDEPQFLPLMTRRRGQLLRELTESSVPRLHQPVALNGVVILIGGASPVSLTLVPRLSREPPENFPREPSMLGTNTLAPAEPGPEVNLPLCPPLKEGFPRSVVVVSFPYFQGVFFVAIIE